MANAYILYWNYISTLVSRNRWQEIEEWKLHLYEYEFPLMHYSLIYEYTLQTYFRILLSNDFKNYENIVCSRDIQCHETVEKNVLSLNKLAQNILRDTDRGGPPFHQTAIPNLNTLA